MLNKFLFPALVMSAMVSGCSSYHNEESVSYHEQNRQTVIDFYEKGINQKDADAALQYVGNRYVQHNPNAEDGREGFRKFISLLKTKFPGSHSYIKSSFVDGDFVILHVNAVREPGTLGFAIIDIFRLENGKIVEHWDVTQTIPERTASGNSMF